jgi:hypothetical protein
MDTAREAFARMFFRICAAALIATFVLGESAQAQSQIRSAMRMPDPRNDFVRSCAPHMLGRWAHPEQVCGCLHDHAAAVVEDEDLREALLRGISETGVPTIETQWVPVSKRSEIGPTFTKIARPALQCMFEPAN